MYGDIWEKRYIGFLVYEQYNVIKRIDKHFFFQTINPIFICPFL